MKISIPRRCHPEKLDESLPSKLAKSVIADATETNGWRIDEQNSLVFSLPTCKLERKDAVMKILNSRVREQFENKDSREVFIRI